MFARALVLFIVSFSALLAYEAWYWDRSRDRQVPLGAGFFAVVMVVIYRVAAAYLGLLAGRSLLTASTGTLPACLMLGTMLLGVWLSSLVLQVGQNVVRARFGAPILPIEFIRRGSFRHPRR